MLKTESLLLFDAADVMRCVQHALAAKEWRPLFGGTDCAPGLHLVHDHGVYLMSNGLPRDVLGDTEVSFSAYAEQCDPARDDDWWETSRMLVGGDDFVEFVAVSDAWLPKLAASKKLRLLLSDDEINIYFSPDEEEKDSDAVVPLGV